jgi:hypothetical protein
MGLYDLLRDSFTFLCIHLEKMTILLVIIQKSPLSARADIEHRKVCDIPSRNPETISFRERRKEFRNNENLSMKQCVKVATSS